MIICGIDNGTTGSITFLEKNDNGVLFLIALPMPTVQAFDFTKQVKRIHRVDHPYLKRILQAYGPTQQMHCFMERPMINPNRFKQSVLAARAFESTLIALEDTKVGFTIIDSRVWQKQLLPRGIKGDELKVAAQQKAKELFPHNKVEAELYADSVCIAFYGLMERTKA